MNEHCYTPQSGGLGIFTQVREKEREKEKEEKRTVEGHFCLMFSCWLNISGILKKEKRKEKRTVSEISFLFLWSSHIKILLYFKYTLVLKCFDCVLSSVDLTYFACILCLGLIPLSLILAKRLIASLNITLNYCCSFPYIDSDVFGRYKLSFFVYFHVVFEPSYWCIHIIFRACDSSSF